jgi:general secretion pathway protein D
VKVISSPYLTVVDGKEARLVIGDQIPYAQTSQSSSTNGNVTVTNAITTLSTGVILDVTPSIRSNNSVDLTIDQQVTTPDSSILNGNTQPIISTREVKSNVIVQSGRTILLGGMIQESVNKTQSGIPIAQTLPIIGNLFKSTNDTSARTELLVMMTPRVVRESSQLENITRLLRDQLHVR